MPAKANPFGEPPNTEAPAPALPAPAIPSRPPKTPPVGATASKGLGVANADAVLADCVGAAMFHTGAAAANGLEGVAAAA